MKFLLLLFLTEPNEKDIKIGCQSLQQLQRTIYQYIVLLRVDKDKLVGTGFIVTHDALITPSRNLKDQSGLITFTSKTKVGKSKRDIRVSTPYNEFLSLALVSSSMPMFCYPRITASRKKFL